MDVDAQTHPNPQPSLHHRKVELQSAQDLTYLQDNLARSALSKLDLHFPPIRAQPQPATVISLGGPTAESSKQQQQTSEPQQNEHAPAADEDEDKNDPFRARVRDLITEFLTETWQNAQHNLTLNGLDASSQPIHHTATLSKAPLPSTSQGTTSTVQSKENRSRDAQEQEGVHFTYAPFDPRLQHKVANLHGELERLTAVVSRLRREAPQKSARVFETMMDDHLRDDDQAYALEQEREQERALELLERGKRLGLDETKLRQREGWSEDVKRMFDIGVQELGTLSGTWTVEGGNEGKKQVMSVTETMGKAVRARDVVMELE